MDFNEIGRKERVKGGIPIIVPLYHREEDTREFFRQLERVTDDYDLILVDNGFDDDDYIHGLNPVTYIKNDENVGVIKAINQGLEVAEGPYIAVLHSDLLIYDEGWLDHIIDFMERRADVGLVGLAGRHSIDESGNLDFDTTIVKMRGYPDFYKPTWRLTEIAVIDGLGWVMRNIGLRLDESFGLMHFYDLDLSLQYIEKDFRVYCAAVEVMHIADIEERSTRRMDEYLKEIGGDDDAYYDAVRAQFADKWRHMLPIVRGYQDETYAYKRIEFLFEEIEEARGHIAHVEREIEAKNKYINDLEGELARLNAQVADMSGKVNSLESGLEDEAHLRSQEPSSKNVSPNDTSHTSRLRTAWNTLKDEGLRETSRRIARRLRGSRP